MGVRKGILESEGGLGDRVAGSGVSGWNEVEDQAWMVWDRRSVQSGTFEGCRGLCLIVLGWGRAVYTIIWCQSRDAFVEESEGNRKEGVLSGLICQESGVSGDVRLG